MNYLIYNSTDGYSNPDKISFRELILTCLKSYGIFGHLRDTNISQLDFNNVDKWLYNTNEIQEDIKHIQTQIQNKRVELENIQEVEIEKEYEKEVARITWHNNPASNYSAAQVERIKKCLEVFEPKLDTFKDLCNMPFINSICKNVIETVEHDLKESKKSAIQEERSRIESPCVVPSYADFKNNYITDKKYWVRQLSNDLERKYDALRSAEKRNSEIKQIFSALDKIDTDNVLV